nr:helix-turn-helix domain-containing protein [Cohnella sp. CFH 77786]
MVDDEDEVREGIKTKTPWAACGFELVGDFDNGRDALYAMERLKPDAVITDICMPYMDGLELAGGIREFHRGVKVAMLTGFENFEYAQRAIRLQVTDYLLKPLNLEEFTQFLDKMRRELDEERRRKEDLSLLRSQLHQSLPLLKERWLDKLAASAVLPADHERRFREYGISLPGPGYAAMTADIDAWHFPDGSGNEPDGELLQFGLYNIVQEIIEQEGLGTVYRTRDGKVSAIVCGEEERIELLGHQLADYIRGSAEKYLKLTVSVGIGRPCGLRELPVSCREALSALDYRFLLGTGRILSIRDMEFGRSKAELEDSGEREKKLISAMRSGSKNRVSDALRDVFEGLKVTFVTTEEGYSAVHGMLTALRSWISGTGLAETAPALEEAAAAVNRMRTLGELQQLLESACLRILDDLSAKRSDVSQTQMMLAEQYIQERYMDENLSLSGCCRHLFLSISYFSTLFKQHTGETFVEYLTRVRMDKAKEMLTLTSLKAYEIAHRVGYGDPHYFSVIFKRHTGLTPKEYRASRKENA